MKNLILCLVFILALANPCQADMAVKKYSLMPASDENVQKGISGKIPAVVICNETVKPDNTYIIMTEKAYQTYLQSIQTELNAWKQIQESGQ